VILSRYPEIDIHDLPATFINQEATHNHTPTAPLITTKEEKLSLKDLEVECIKRALQLAKGNQKKAAEILNITRDTLRYRLKKFGIKASEFRN